MKTHIFLFSIVVFISCNKKQESNTGNTERVQYKLEEVQVFGSKTIVDLEQNKTGGPLLSRVMGIAVSNQGKVYVLDNGLKKIAVFREDGEFEMEIRKGEGSGPGEFSLINAIDVNDQGIVSVFDYNNRRASLFQSEDGTHLKDVDIPVASRSILNLGDRLIANIYPARRYMLAVYPLNEDTENVNYLLSLTDRDREFAEHGVTAMLGRLASGEVLIGLQTPGVWYVMREDSLYRFGQDLVSERVLEYYPDDGISVSPAYTLGIGQVLGDKIGIVWQEMLYEKPRPVIGGIYMEIFTAGGEHLYQIKLSVNWLQAVTFDSKGNIYLVENRDDFTVIVKYAVIEA